MTGKPHNSANPRKFKEKIELLRQKEAQLTANFMEVMRGIPALTRSMAPYPDSANKDVSQSSDSLPTSRLLDPLKSSLYVRGRDNSSRCRFAMESNTCSSNRDVYNPGGGGDNGSGGPTPQTDDLESQAQSSRSSQRRKVETKIPPPSQIPRTAELTESSLLSSQISPLRLSHTPPAPSSSTYQPNLPPVSVSSQSPSNGVNSSAANSTSTPLPPPSSQYYSNTNNMNSSSQFHQPAPPSNQSSRGCTLQPSWGFPSGGQACETTPSTGGATSAVTNMISGMSLMDYRRTYSDSCIPSSFSEPTHPRRFAPPCQQYPRQQAPAPTVPPPVLPPPIPSHHHQQQQQQQRPRTLPSVDEFTLPRYQHANSVGASSSQLYFKDSLPSPRSRHQSSTSVSLRHYQQNHSHPSSHQYPFRRLQSDYHSMRNIPQRYGPVHHNHHQVLTEHSPTTNSSHQVMMTSDGSYNNPCQPWMMMNGGGVSTSACDVFDVSSSSLFRLKGSDINDQFRGRHQHQVPLLQPLPQTQAASMGYDSHSPSSSGYFEPSSSAGTHAFAGYHHHHHHHHQQQQQQQQQRHQQATRAPLAVSTSALASVAAISNTNNGGIFINSNNSAVPASSSTGSLTQPLDLIGLDGEAFPSPEPEGRRDSFSMAVDLLSRLEKRPLDASGTSPPLPLWSSGVGGAFSPPPSKSAKMENTCSAITASAGNTTAPAFYVPIAANDLQILTEPSLANYVTDAATEDQLVREQYSPT